MRTTVSILLSLILMTSLWSVSAGEPGASTWPPDDWLNQDWELDHKWGCDIDRPDNGRWYSSSGWWRADSGEEQGDSHDSRLISPPIDVGNDGFTLTFDHDYLNHLGNGDIAQILVIHVIGDDFTTCSYQDHCNDMGSDSRIWCTLGNSWGYGTTVHVPPEQASGTIRLMLRYMNDMFYGTGSGYFRVSNLDIEAAPCAPPVTTIETQGPRHDADHVYVSSGTMFHLETSNPDAPTEYRIDGGDWTPFEAPFNLTGPDGSYLIEYRSGEDDCMEETRELEVFLDNTPPEVEITEPAPVEDNEELDSVKQGLQETCQALFSEDVCQQLLEGPLGLEGLGPVFDELEAAAIQVDEICRSVFSDAICDSTTGTLVDTLVGLREQAEDGANSPPAVWGTVTVKADAFDPENGGSASGMDRVEFYVNDELRHTATAAPWEWEWDTTEEENGEHTLRAVGVDRVDNRAQDTLRVLVVPEPPA